MASKSSLCQLILSCSALFYLQTSYSIALASGTQHNERKLVPPIVINTWNFTDANARAWQELSARRSALDAIEKGCGQCEIDRCDGTVGWGGSPSETGETTLDAMIMDGETYDVGAVGGLRRVKGAIAVARMVLERTNHTLLVGEMATQFAIELGFQEESLTSNESNKLWADWRNNSCQPNYWRNVSPDPKTSCGPYKPSTQRAAASLGDKIHQGSFSSSATNKQKDYYSLEQAGAVLEEEKEKEAQGEGEATSVDKSKALHGHDTIGMVAIDSENKIAAGTSTNGLRFKILGRVGDSPVPGAGSYAAKEAGAAAATGDGDVMMRFLLSYQGVENLRRGLSAQESADDVIGRQISRTKRPYAEAAVIVLAKDGSFGAACCGFSKFPFVVSDSRQQLETIVVDCKV